MSKPYRRPNPVLYFFAGIYFCLHNKFKYHLKVTGTKPSGPALILCNHTSNHDHEFMVSVTYPRRLSFMATYHWFTFKKLGFWLKAIKAIPKLQFAPDIESVQKVRDVINKRKGMVFIAPEGTIYANGKLGYINPSIAKMIRFLKVPVYASKIQGAGLGNAKWSRFSHKGYVSVHTEQIISQEETRTLKTDEIMGRIISSLSYNDFEYAEKERILIKEDNRACGFETMFYKCPCCHNEFSITSENNSVKCNKCGALATIKEDFSFSWTGKEFFKNYIEWYDWQYEELKKEMMNPDFELKEEVDYGTDKPGIDNYVKVGHGIMTLNRHGWTYQGTFEGKEITEHDELKEIPLATLKIGLHFELPYKYGHCRVFYPSDGLTSMKWHLASRIISENEVFN